MRRPRTIHADPPIVWLAWLAFIAFVVGTMVAVDAYGGASFWPGLVGQFGASLGAFVLALSWDRQRERSRVESAAGELRERLAKEVRLRLRPVREELRRNKVSLEYLAEAFADEPDPGTFRILHPELLDGAWLANATRLVELVTDYELSSKLSSTYGRIEELRWRLRQRTAQVTMALDEMTKPLVTELLDEVNDVYERVGGQISQPTVQAVGRDVSGNQPPSAGSSTSTALP